MTSPFEVELHGWPFEIRIESRTGNNNPAFGADRIRWDISVKLTHSIGSGFRGSITYYVVTRMMDINWPFIGRPSPETVFELLPESERAFALACSIAGKVPDDIEGPELREDWA